MGSFLTFDGGLRGSPSDLEGETRVVSSFFGETVLGNVDGENWDWGCEGTEGVGTLWEGADGEGTTVAGRL